MMNSHFGRLPRLLALGAALVACLAGLCPAGPARAQAADSGSVTIYKGARGATAGLTLGSWGSGSATEDTAHRYGQSSASIRIVSHGLYQGGKLTLAKPIDLAPYLTNRNAFLQFAFITENLPADPTMPSLGSFGDTPVKMQKAPAVQYIRVGLVTTKNTAISTSIPMEYGVPSNNWKLMSMPVTYVKALSATDASIKEVRFFADQPAALYIGQLGILVESADITADPMSDFIIPRNEDHLFTVNAVAGVSPLKYEWDFGDTSPVEKTEKPSIQHTYRRQGDFEAKVTITDYFGQKTPKEIAYKLHITP